MTNQIMFFSLFNDDNTNEIKNDNQNANNLNPKTVFRPSQRKRNNHQLYQSINLKNIDNNNVNHSKNCNKEVEEDI